MPDQAWLRANGVVFDVVQPLWQSVLPLWGRYLSVFDVLRVLESFTRCSIDRTERRADRGHYILKVMRLYLKKHTLCHNEISFWGPNNGPSFGSALLILFTARSPKTEPFFMSLSIKNKSPCGSGFVSSSLRYHRADKFYCSRSLLLCWMCCLHCISVFAVVTDVVLVLLFQGFTTCGIRISLW